MSERLPLDELRQWAKDRRHFDATRDQPPMGQALLDLIDDRDRLMRRATGLRVAVEAARGFTGRVRAWTSFVDDDRDEAADLFDLLEQAIADDDRSRGAA